MAPKSSLSPRRTAVANPSPSVTSDARKRSREEPRLYGHGIALEIQQRELELNRLAAAQAEMEERRRRWVMQQLNPAPTAGTSLRQNLDQLLLAQPQHRQHVPQMQPEEDPGDAESFCGSNQLPAGRRTRVAPRRLCRRCGRKEAAVVILPCRHLCLCGACEKRVASCPVCQGDKAEAIHAIL